MFDIIKKNIGIWTLEMVKKASNKALADGKITQKQYDELIKTVESK